MSKSPLTPSDARVAVRDFVLANYLVGERPENLRDDTPLQTSGILDSLGVQTLATFIEESFQLELDASDTTPDRFNSIAEITAVIARKLAVTR
jgi:acyl carrier protein